MDPLLGRTVRAVDSPPEVVKDAEVLVTIPSSHEPVSDGTLVEPGQHLNIAGSNMLRTRELDDEAIRRADRIVVVARKSRSRGWRAAWASAAVRARAPRSTLALRNRAGS